MRSQIRSSKENVKDVLLDCGGWAGRRDNRDKVRNHEEEEREVCFYLPL